MTMWVAARGGRRRGAPLAALGVLVVALLLAAAGPAFAEPPAPPSDLTEPQQAVQSGKVWDSYGHNTHLNYYDTIYGSYDQYAPLIKELGVTQLRDGVPGNDDLMRKYKDLCASGVRFTISTNPATDFGALPGILKELGRDCITAVTGDNEPDLFHYLHDIPEGEWAGRTMEQQRRLHDLMKGDPELADMPVASFSPTGQFEKVDASGIADWCDTHPYGSYYGLTHNDGYSNVYRHLERTAPTCGDLPRIFTEVGFHNALRSDSGHRPTSESAAAVMMAKAVVSYWNAGVLLHHNYEFLDEGEEDLAEQENNFGIVRRDFSKKPAFETMRRFGQLIKDPGGAAFTPGSLAYAVSGDTERVETLLMQDSRGTFKLAVQSNDPVWDGNAVQDLVPPTRQITIQLGTAADVKVHSVTGEQPVQEYTNVTEVPLELGRDLFVLEIGGDAGGAAISPEPEPELSPSPSPSEVRPSPAPADGAVDEGAGEADQGWFADLVERLRALVARIAEALGGGDPGDGPAA
jgi:hypothetical protein